MTRAWAARAAILALSASVASAASACTRSLDPYGEALIYVDTDLAVPAHVARLRLDLYTHDGTWFESREIGRADPRDWPASFAVYSEREDREDVVLVRLRAYPENATRDYRGERFEARASFVEPRAPASIDEGCANAPLLPLGGRLTLRRGAEPITQLAIQPPCTEATRVGSTIARIQIEKAGRYQISVADMSPFAAESTLSVRRSCTDASTQIYCDAQPNVNPMASGHFPRLNTDLTPGSYYVITAGAKPDQPADVTVELVSLDDPPETLPPIAPPAATTVASPRILREGADVTPRLEPTPATTIDRLLLVRLRPGRREALHVTLRGACSGTMAKIGARPGSVDVAEARTCVDAENVRVPLTEALSAGAVDDYVPPPSVQGSFGADSTACPSGDPTSKVVCVPAGVFLLGDDRFAFGGGTLPSSPRRLARMSRFYMDRHEVTVGELRAAIAGGLVVDPRRLVTNDAPLSFEGSDRSRPYDRMCTYSSKPMGREDHPVNCITWRAARDYCVSKGGDLPTEAQWEYAASAAGRPTKTLYPWGDDPPSCERGVFGRSRPSSTLLGALGICATAGLPELLQPVTDVRGDVTPLGIAGLAGSVREWIRDSYAAYDEPCWHASAMTNPSCVEQNARFRSGRGSSWVEDGIAPAALRVGSPAAIDPSGDPTFGLRCVYAEAR